MSYTLNHYQYTEKMKEKIEKTIQLHGKDRYLWYNLQFSTGA